MISIGAVPGAFIRWQIDEIFIVNTIGCFLYGFINSLSITKRNKLILGVGFCGSMTAFSGWSLYLNRMLNEGLYKLFLVHSISIVLLGVFAVGLGHILAKNLKA